MNTLARIPTSDLTDPIDPPEDLVADDRPGDEDERVDWWAELRGLALMLLAVIGFHTFVAKPFYIPSESMMPNLLVGDRLVVSKFPYGWSWVSASFHVLPRGDWRVLGATPEYGDIVIAVPPDRAEDYIKRVVALPGDRIAVVNGQIVLNGKAVPQTVDVPVDIPVDANAPCNSLSYTGAKVRLADGSEVCRMPAYRETMPNGATYQVLDTTKGSWLDNRPEVVVPDGHVFLMGDNRDNSADSRAAMAAKGLDGPVPLSSVGGRAEFTTFSLDGTTGWNPLTWIGSLREGRAWRTLRPAMKRGAGDDGER